MKAEYDVEADALLIEFNGKEPYRNAMVALVQAAKDNIVTNIVSFDSGTQLQKHAIEILNAIAETSLFSESALSYEDIDLNSLQERSTQLEEEAEKTFEELIAEGEEYFKDKQIEVEDYLKKAKELSSRIQSNLGEYDESRDKDV